MFQLGSFLSLLGIDCEWCDARDWCNKSRLLLACLAPMFFWLHAYGADGSGVTKGI